MKNSDIETITKIQELASENPELSSCLTKLSDNLHDAVLAIDETCGILSILQTQLFNYVGVDDDIDMDSETMSIAGIERILNETSKKVSNAEDLMHNASRKE